MRENVLILLDVDICWKDSNQQGGGQWLARYIESKLGQSRSRQLVLAETVCSQECPGENWLNQGEFPSVSEDL